MKSESIMCGSCYKSIAVKRAGNILKVTCPHCEYQFHHVFKVRDLKSFYYYFAGDPDNNYDVKQAFKACGAGFIWVLILGYSGFNPEKLNIFGLSIIDNTIEILIWLWPVFLVAFYPEWKAEREEKLSRAAKKVQKR